MTDEAEKLIAISSLTRYIVQKVSDGRTIRSTRSQRTKQVERDATSCYCCLVIQYMLEFDFTRDFI